VSSDFFSRVRSEYQKAAEAGKLKGLNETLAQIAQNARQGYQYVDEVDLGEGAVRELRQQGFQVIRKERHEGDYRDNRTVPYYEIRWDQEIK
jgi:hypothetical protein